MKVLDTSLEFMVYRYNSGVKLLGEDHLIKNEYYQQSPTGYSVADLLNLPFNVYFYNTDHQFQNSNEFNAEALGFESIHACIGKSVEETCTPETTTEVIFHNNQEILSTNKIKIYEEDITRIDSFYYNCLSIKFPWYNADNKIQGIFGCSIMTGKHSLSDSLNQLTTLGLLASPSLNFKQKYNIPGTQIEETYLSSRESEILYHLVRGKTAKLIGQILGISKRTVEQHLENIKKKLKVSNKSDLIERVVDIFFDKS